MSSLEVGHKVLEILEKESSPVRPESLYAKLEGAHQIDESESREVVVDLAVQHKIEITADRRLTLPKGNG